MEGFIGASCGHAFSPLAADAVNTVATALREDYASLIDVQQRLHTWHDKEGASHVANASSHAFSAAVKELVGQGSQILRRLDEEVATVVEAGGLSPGADGAQAVNMTMVRLAAKICQAEINARSLALSKRERGGDSKALMSALNRLLSQVGSGHISMCPRDGEGHECSDQGECKCEEACPDGACKCECACDSGWGGEDCSSRTCMHDCSGHNGVCVNGGCICHQGWTGTDCSRPETVDCVKACMSQCLLKCASSTKEQPAQALGKRTCYNDCYKPCLAMPSCGSQGEGAGGPAQSPKAGYMANVESR